MKESTNINVPKNSPRGDYEFLGDHMRRTDNVYRTGEQTRAEYLNLTDRLIHRMTDGVEVDNPRTGEREIKKPDTVIFLDKSARPLSWLVRDIWSRLAIDDDGVVQKQPKFAFLNIDRNQWTNSIDADGQGSFDIDEVDQSIIWSLRSIFVETKNKRMGLTKEIESAPASLDDETVLLVDEVGASGRTLSTAEKLIHRAFPTAAVAGVHWMPERAYIRGVEANSDRPPWYSEVDPRGRGVNDRLKYPMDASPENLTQSLGRWFLSTRFEKPDEISLKIREELGRLATDRSIPIMISTERYLGGTDDDYDHETRRIERVNNGLSRRDVEKRLRKIWDGKRGPRR